jgi:hypothetical protein
VSTKLSCCCRSRAKHGSVGAELFPDNKKAAVFDAAAFD